MRFRDRTHAGELLADAVEALGLPDPVVFGLARGGVAVAAPIAAALGVPLDVIVVRKVGAPAQRELAIGAVAEGGVTVVDTDLLAAVGIPEARFLELADVERVELERRVARFHPTGARHDLLGRDVVIVDDGLATGSTAEAAVESVRMRKPRRVVLAVPVAAAASLDRLRGEADEVVVLHRPDAFGSVGEWYDDFRQVGDDDVSALLIDPSMHRP